MALRRMTSGNIPNQVLEVVFNDLTLALHMATVADGAIVADLGAIGLGINVGDIEIGAVEIKNAADDTRAEVNAGNTAAVGDVALWVADANVKASIDSFIYADDADWTDSTSKHALVGGLYQSTQQTITDGDVGPIQLDAHGNQIVTLLATDSHFGAVGAASDIDGVVHGQLRYLGGQLVFGSGTMAVSHAVTLATDDTQYGPVGADADVDGNVHGQLRYIGEQTSGLETTIQTLFDLFTGGGSDFLGLVEFKANIDAKLDTLHTDLATLHTDMQALIALQGQK